MHPVRYEVVTVHTGVKRPFARPAKFTNKRLAIKHAQSDGDAGFVFDLKNGRKRRIFSRI